MSKFSELLKVKNWRIWFKGLFNAIINGLAGGVTLAVAKPDTFNPFSSGFSNFAYVVIITGILGAANYIKQSPMPILEEMEEL